MARTKSGTKKGSEKRVISLYTEEMEAKVDVKVYPHEFYWLAYSTAFVTTFCVGIIVAFSFGVVDEDIPPLFGMFIAFSVSLIIIGWTSYFTTKLVDKIEVFNKLREARIQELQEQATEIVGKVEVYVKKLATTEEKYEKLLKKHLELQNRKDHERVQQG